MTTPISTPPWDLAAGNRWTLEQDGLIDHGNESITAKDGQIVAYVAGGMENGNGALLAAAPALRDFAELFALDPPACASQPTKPAGHGGCDCWSCSLMSIARKALKQAGAL